jgi:hypothetical protein
MHVFDTSYANSAHAQRARLDGRVEYAEMRVNLGIVQSQKCVYFGVSKWHTRDLVRALRGFVRIPISTYRQDFSSFIGNHRTDGYGA